MSKYLLTIPMETEHGMQLACLNAYNHEESTVSARFAGGAFEDVPFMIDKESNLAVIDKKYAFPLQLVVNWMASNGCLDETVEPPVVHPMTFSCKFVTN